MQDFDRALAINPRLTSAYYGRGLERGLAEFNRALELDPQMIAGYANRGLALLRQGKNAEAEQDLQRALALDPTLKPGSTAKKLNLQFNQ